MVTGVILAGGSGSRIGGDKASRLLGGRPLAQWAADALDRVADEIIVAIAPDQTPPAIRSRVPAYACFDLLPARGPLTGIYTGLDAARGDCIVVVPCDAPFVEPALLSLLLERRRGWDCVVPEADGILHPTIGVYARSCLPTMIEALNGDSLSIRAFLSRARTLVVPEADLRVVDPELRSFFNVNRLADLCRAEAMIATLAAR